MTGERCKGNAGEMHIYKKLAGNLTATLKQVSEPPRGGGAPHPEDT